MRDQGKVITVNGPIEPDQLGITLMHEHLLFTCLMWFLEENHRGLGSDSYAPVTARNAALLRQFPYHNRDNLINTDWYLTAMEIRRFKMALGRTVVDSSDLGLGRDVWGLRKIADDVGMNIISGTGYYVDDAQFFAVLGHQLQGLGDLFRSGLVLVDQPRGVLGRDD